MEEVLKLPADSAKAYFLEGSSYFNNSLPGYFNFALLLARVDKLLKGRPYPPILKRPKNKLHPADLSDVNYPIITNKDGRFDWRPLELMHPVIYVSLVNMICEDDNWKQLTDRFTEFQSGFVECCSLPVRSTTDHSNWAEQVRNWWIRAEQRSLERSFRFSHMLQTDIVNCYGSLYTHSIEWALHGREEAKRMRQEKAEMLGSKIDCHIRAGRYGQTNGICQGSALMDFVAELVLGYVDAEITSTIKNKKIKKKDFEIVRYRDDYRIFANNKEVAEEILRIIADEIRPIGMKLSAEKTIMHENVVRGAIKRDKRTGIQLQGLDTANAKTVQKRLLRLHSFGSKYPNSGALRRLLTEFFVQLVPQEKLEQGGFVKFPLGSPPSASGKDDEFDDAEIRKDLPVLASIVTDIGMESPIAFPIIAAILSQLLSRGRKSDSLKIWRQVRNKVNRCPNNELLQIWMQRGMLKTSLGSKFAKESRICEAVVGSGIKPLWNSTWLDDSELSQNLRGAFVPRYFIDRTEVNIANATIGPDEVALFATTGY